MSSSFSLHLQSATHYECFEGIRSFVGQDATGSFGILPGRASFLTILTYGLARFRVADGPWKYIACPGAVLSFEMNQLCLNTRRYLVDDDYEHISALLTGQLAEEEKALLAVKDNIQRLEQELLRRLHQLNRSP
jgi:F-type H+-transporting ATPase subunit epsilon